MLGLPNVTLVHKILKKLDIALKRMSHPHTWSPSYKCTIKQKLFCAEPQLSLCVFRSGSTISENIG